MWSLDGGIPVFVALHNGYTRSEQYQRQPLAGRIGPTEEEDGKEAGGKYLELIRDLIDGDGEVGERYILHLWR